MYYIISDAGIAVTETNRAPLFIPKTHQNYNSILSQIENLSYNELQNLADNKTSVVGYVNEHIESYENDDGDFEIRLSGMKELEKEIITSFEIEVIKLNENTNKGKALLNILKNSNISSIKITLN